jgi:hypothetical protein
MERVCCLEAYCLVGTLYCYRSHVFVIFRQSTDTAACLDLHFIRSILCTLLDSLVSFLLPHSPIFHSYVVAEKTPIVHQQLENLDPWPITQGDAMQS